MESQPQNPEFRNNPENFRPCKCWDVPLNLFVMTNLTIMHILKACVQTVCQDYQQKTLADKKLKATDDRSNFTAAKESVKAWHWSAYK